MAKYVFVTGGVVSALGKGIAAASLGNLLKARGLKVILQKFDPYLNVDPGTMSPYQHGEVYVLDDGAECDLDLGHYERFTDTNLSQINNLTSGRVYETILANERKGEYLGRTVQVIPHVTDEIKRRIKLPAKQDPEVDVVITEIGGTVGDIESLPFLEAIRQFRLECPPEDTISVHLTLVPYIETAGEIKTKPTQHSVAELRIDRHPARLPDLPRPPADRRGRPAQDRPLLQPAPGVRLRRAGRALHLRGAPELPPAAHGRADLQAPRAGDARAGPGRLGAHGQAHPQPARHGAHRHRRQVRRAEGRLQEHHRVLHPRRHPQPRGGGAGLGGLGDPRGRGGGRPPAGRDLRRLHGMLVPGGFGDRGIQGKMRAVHWARENGVPFFGICLGLQCAMIEIGRDLVGLERADSAEFAADTPHPVIHLMETQKGIRNLGGTMRLGAWPCVIRPGTLAARCYGETEISERHRHRYEVNNDYRERFAQVGVVFSGTSPDGRLVEIIELPGHPFFIAVQFHPELKSRPNRPHPLFREFVAAAVAHQGLARNAAEATS